MVNTAMTERRYKRRNMRANLLALARQRPSDFWVDSISKQKAFLRVGSLRLVLRKTDSLLRIIRRIRAERVEAAIRHASRIIKSCEGKGKDQQKAIRFLREIIRQYRCLVLTDKQVVRLKHSNPHIIPLESDLVSSLYGERQRYHLCIM